MAKPLRYRDKQNPVEVMQFDGTDFGAMEIFVWVDGLSDMIRVDRETGLMIIMTVDKGAVRIHKSDWVVRDKNGIFSVYSPEIFAYVYSPASKNNRRVQV